MVSDFNNMSDEDLMALLGGGAPMPSGSNLPTGYAMTPQGPVRFQNGQMIPVSTEELITAQQREAAAGRSAAAGMRQPQYTVDERTGQVVQMTPGAQVGFAGIDPREKLQAELAQQGFSNQFQLRAQAFNELESAQNNMIKMAQMAEEAKLNRASLRERGADRGEQARQANLKAAVDQYQTALSLVPQMGQLSIQESERVQGILNSGGDFLARAFESRGGTSPLARVTQADQINALSGTMHQLRGMVDQAIARGPAFSEYSPAGNEMEGYEAPNLGTAGMGSNLPAAPQAPNFQFSPAPAPSPAQAGAGSGGGGFAEAAPAAAGTEPVDWRQAWIDNVDWMQRLKEGAGGAPSPASGKEWPNEEGYLVESNFTPPTQEQIDLERAGGKRYLQGFGDKIGGFLRAAVQPASQRTPLGYAEGGYTKEPAFLGNEEGAELFLNPTNAPIAVVPADDTRKMGFKRGTMPGYEDGSGFHADRELKTRPTGGFWNSLRESMGTGRYDDMDFTDLMGMVNQDMREHPENFMVGGGFSGLGKAGPQVIPPGLARKALAEMRRADILRRIEQAVEMGRKVPGFATGTMNQPTDQFYGQGAGFTVGATSKLAGMGGAPVIPPNAPRYLGGDRYNVGGLTLNPGETVAGKLAGYTMAPDGSYQKPAAPAPYKPVTQQELIATARAAAPPAVTDVLAGKTARPMTALESQAVPGQFLKTITARQLQGLTPEEIQALGTMTNTEYNAPLSYVLGRTQAQYGTPQGESRRGFLKGAGI